MTIFDAQRNRILLLRRHSTPDGRKEATGRFCPTPATRTTLSRDDLLGGLGRLISLAVHGWPQWFQIALAVIEIGLPPVLFWLAPSEERAAPRTAERGAALYRSQARDL
ncbi:DUF4345 domain-containing protein [Streptomyces sp. B4I13]|uniref:DUF4345 domain-containing protein n=1 Tax=Streptomyces sp. B4I13 TaxID=3042271 RepID=UPI003593F6CE